MTHPGWRRPPWFDQGGRRIGFLHQLRQLEGVRIARDPKRRSGFVVSFVLSPNGIEPRAVTVQFLPQSPNTPRVYVDGLSDSPHRYDDGALCMWYPQDDASMRWTPNAGPSDLVTRIAVHLIKEDWFRRTGEWIGEEVKHQRRDEANDPEVT